MAVAGKNGAAQGSWGRDQTSKPVALANFRGGDKKAGLNTLKEVEQEGCQEKELVWGEWKIDADLYSEVTRERGVCSNNLV